MSCNDKIKLSCPPDSPYASCVRSEVKIPEFSTLGEGCFSVQEIELDLYTLIGRIKDDINVSFLTSDCQTLPTPKTVSSLIDFLLKGHCTQKIQIEALVSQNAAQALEIATLQNSNCH